MKTKNDDQAGQPAEPTEADDDTGSWDRSTAAVILGLVLLPVLLRLFMG